MKSVLNICDNTDTKMIQRMRRYYLKPLLLLQKHTPDGHYCHKCAIKQIRKWANDPESTPQRNKTDEKIVICFRVIREK